MLLQLVAKRLLGDYAKSLKGADAAAMAGFVAAQVGDAAFNRSGLRALGQALVDFGSTARSVGVVRGPDAQRQLLTDRVHSMVAEIAGRLKGVGRLAPAEAAALFNANQNELIDAAMAHAELLEWEAFTDAVESIADPGTKRVLTWLRDSSGSRSSRSTSPGTSSTGASRPTAPRRSPTTSTTVCCRGCAPTRSTSSRPFGLTPELVRAPIASGAEKQRQDEARGYYVARRAAGDEPVEEAVVAKSAR